MEAEWSEAGVPVSRGTLVAGKYRVDRVLGAGGMGVVVAALQVDLDRAVALKFLRPEVAPRPEQVTRFAREARAAAKLQSEHVTRVLDVGMLDSGAAYIVMEYLEGEDLGNLLAKSGPLPCGEAVKYSLEASEGVAEAHACGIVHRDLKPANLFLAHRTNGRPIIKVLDFGLSKISAGEDRVTSESSILGSPVYMSPEQLLSPHAADARSDIWSLGVTLYEMLTGQRAFRGERLPELLAGILHGCETPLESFRLDVPAGLRQAVHRCLQKDPSRRFANIADFAEALAPFGPPSSAASVERISHLLGVGVASRGASDERASGPSADTALGDVPLRAPTAARSLPAASRSLILPAVPGAADEPGVRAAIKLGWGGWVVGGVFALSAGVAIDLAAGHRAAGRDGGVGPPPPNAIPAPLPSIAAGTPGPDAPPTNAAPAAPFATTLSASQSPPAAASAPIPKASPSKGKKAGRVDAVSTPSTSAAPAPPPGASAPHASDDPLAKLRTL